MFFKMAPTDRTASPVRYVKKLRMIFIEKIYTVMMTSKGIIQKEVIRDKNKIASPTQDNLTIYNSCTIQQTNPDDTLILEEAHYYHTYFGQIEYRKPAMPQALDHLDRKLNANMFTGDDEIIINDYNFNIIFNQVNRTQTWPEVYSRYGTLRREPAVRTLSDRLIDLHTPIPEYYTYDEQKYFEPETESMDEMIKNYYQADRPDRLYRTKLSKLLDETTNISSMIIRFNDVTGFLSKEGGEVLRVHFVDHLYRLIGSIKYDLENYGLALTLIIMTSKNGFDIKQLNTKIQYNPVLQKTIVNDFYTMVGKHYEEQFKSIAADFPSNIDLQLFLLLEPFMNTVTVYINDTQKQTNLSQRDVNDSIITELL